MNSQAMTELQISIDGRTITAQPRPEDQATLAELLQRGATVKVEQADADTEGHSLAGNEIAVDVEGHAMTLRLPNSGDAAAIRRVLAVGALTASVAVGGLVASSFVQPQTQTPPITIPRAPAAEPAQMTINSDAGMADSASQKASDAFVQSRGAAVPAPAPVKITTTPDQSDQDVNVGNRGHAATDNAPANQLPPQPNRDGGSHPE